MKNLSRLAFTCAILFSLTSCLVEKEPVIPSNSTNELQPIFILNDITLIDKNSFLAKTKLKQRGNLRIKDYGWVWSDKNNPTIFDSKIQFSNLTRDSFSTEISNLDSSKIYFLRPFIVTGAGITYGMEQCSSLDVDFKINTYEIVFEGAAITFSNNSSNSGDYEWLWDFGDGTFSNEFSPIHTFNKQGKVVVAVYAKKRGCVTKKEIQIEITEDPFKDYWVNIEGGMFSMGSSEGYPSEKPVHQVTLGNFSIGKTEITQNQWELLMGKDIISYFFDCGQCPMESVSWNDIQEFIKILRLKTGRNIRLPTEAEWEYAAKGGNMSANYLYPGSNNIKEVAWTLEDSRIARPSIVGQKKPNELSLFDMGGNVSEWCLDWYGPYASSAQVNPQGPKFGNKRITRGGGWNNGPIPSTSRIWFAPDDRHFSLGFRLVWVL